MSAQRILVAGGGIGGLTLANALQRCAIPFTVLERAPAFGDVGFGITLPHNAMRALEKIDPDLERRVFEAGVQNIDTLFLDQNASITFKNPPPYTPEKAKYGDARYVPISRTVLQEQLLHSIRPENISFSSDIEDFDQTSAGVRVRLENGQELDGSLLVGCDGLRSEVRRLLHEKYPQELGPPPEVSYSGLSLWGGMLDNYEQKLPEQERGAFAWYVGVQGSLFLHLPIGSKHYWSLGVRMPEPMPGDSMVGRDGRPPHELKNWLEEKTAVYHPDLAAHQLVADTNPDTITRWDLFEVVRRKDDAQRWGHGLVTVLGDAAHAVTPWLGQGGATSMEDAYDLAHRLSKADESAWPAALEAYEHKRHPRTQKIRDEARQNEGIFLSNPNSLRGWLMNRAFVLMGHSPWVTEKLMSWTLDFDEPSEPLAPRHKQ